MPKPCRICHGTTHATTFCFFNKKRRPKQLGKKGMEWIKYRKEWFKANPPVNGYYVCYLCGDHLLPKQTTLDHVIPRSNRPDLVFEDSNIKPCCFRCNTLKGSKH